MRPFCTARICRTQGAAACPGPLKMHRVPEKGVSGTEYHSRTREAYSAHRVPLKMRRVPQEPVLRTARIFRTTGGLLRYRMSRMPQMAEERSLFPRQHYRKSNKHQKKRPLPKTAPSANSPQPQSRGSREIFIQAAVLPRMDLTIF